jgi:exodeoxyribonuclease VII small subunit
MSDKESPPPNFEQGLAELETVVKELESGDLPLEKALELFEKGVALSSACRKQLVEAETRVEALVRKNDKLQTEPFPPETA